MPHKGTEQTQKKERQAEEKGGTEKREKQKGKGRGEKGRELEKRESFVHNIKEHKCKAKS